MAYALIPDGFTLKKVTPQQQEAVSAKRSHDNFRTILSNPATMQTASIALVGLAVTQYLPAFIEALEAKVGTLSDDFKEGINDTVNELNPLNAVRKLYGGLTTKEFIAEIERRAKAEQMADAGGPKVSFI